ncbi:MAG: hypothetical protein COB67_05665 [SAR324 cluster bacterium]|uniref:MPN domain-containing protein n=1 Tax=SAR324 cluster bacterium TaxID=2024889 RepID=A0A2A4T604_9DELT|nr:MAG: hypothetical protein COB67_05665 [SAR324 cluster bacterium]
MKIKQEVRDQIIAHAKADTPIEVCGYLAETDGLVDIAYPLINVDQAEDHYTLDPKEQFATIKKIREAGRKVSAVYHSHPETPSRMSEEDIRLAYDPTISYVIVSLAAEEPVVNSFKVRKGVVEKELVEVII